MPSDLPTLQSKILDRTALVERFGRPRSGRLVFTNGCFDILHPGHVAYLDEARRLGDRLVLGVNTDDSVRRQGKGADRPLVTQDARLRVLAGLASIDALCLFDEDTPLELITALRPDVLVKGGDYTIDTIVGAPEVQADGGEVKVIPFLPGYSTTSLLERIRTAKG